MDSRDFQDRVVVVTGGASGMGAASARLFAQRGAIVLIVDRNRAAAVAMATEIGAPSPLIGDVASVGFCESVISEAATSYGRLDGLVNCAGVICRHDALGTTDVDWERVMATNVNGVFYLSRAAVRVMRQRRSGAIVNFGSIWGSVGSAGALAYCVSKGAVHQMTRAMALDHAEDNIRVNAICPGEVNTPMLAAERPQPPSEAQLHELAESTVPMKRLAEPIEIARVAVFLASDEASYMTGALVNVDAGYTAR